MARDAAEQYPPMLRSDRPPHRLLAALAACLACASLSPTPPLAATAVEAAAPPVKPAPPRQYREGLHGVDLDGLSEAQQELALKILNESGCRCGCGMTVAQCRVEDQNCPRSPLLARAIVDAVRRGGDEEAVRAAYRHAAGIADPPAASGAGRRGTPHGSTSRGAAQAPVTLIEYSDFECGFCRVAQGVVREVLAEYPGRVRLEFKHYPLPSHANARPAALAAEAARQQGMFWEMHDRLFADAARLDAAGLREHARALGLDLARFEAAMAGPEAAAAVDRDIAEGGRNGIPGTPTFFVNGQQAANYDIASLRSAIDAALASGQAK